MKTAKKLILPIISILLLIGAICVNVPQIIQTPSPKIIPVRVEYCSKGYTHADEYLSTDPNGYTTHYQSVCVSLMQHWRASVFCPVSKIIIWRPIIRVASIRATP